MSSIPSAVPYGTRFLVVEDSSLWGKFRAIIYNVCLIRHAKSKRTCAAIIERLLSCLSFILSQKPKIHTNLRSIKVRLLSKSRMKSSREDNILKKKFEKMAKKCKVHKSLYVSFIIAVIDIVFRPNYVAFAVFSASLFGSHTQKFAAHFSPLTTGCAACSARSSPLPSSNKL